MLHLKDSIYTDIKGIQSPAVIPEDVPDIHSVLSQPFKYLDGGSRTVAFLSSDGQYVLKLLKSPAAIATQFKMWGIDLATVSWSPAIGNASAAAEILFHRSVESIKLAARELQHQTGLIYVHLMQTSSLKTKLNAAGFQIEADAIPFVIQVKAQLVKDRLTELLDRGDSEKAKLVLDQVLDLVIDFWSHGITEDTFNFHTNYGYTGADKLIQIDVGELHHSLPKLLEEARDQRILRNDSFKWLASTYPDLASYFTQQVHHWFPQAVAGLFASGIPSAGTSSTLTDRKEKYDGGEASGSFHELRPF